MSESELEKTTFMKEHEVAEKLGVSTGTLRNWRSQGVGPAFHKMPSIRYSVKDVIEYIEKTRVETAGGNI